METILVVDDSLPARYSTARVLAAAGFDVREAATGREALRLAPVANLILLDIALPDIDGFELCTRLKTDRVTRDTPIVYKTAVYRGDEHRTRALALGADDYLTDPVDPTALVECVRRLISVRGDGRLTSPPTPRAERTRDKTRRGGLPAAPRLAAPALGPGVGEPCSGCGEPTTMTEVQYTVSWGGAVTFSFHEDCYRVWSAFAD